jgi:hypothetical protein
MSSASHDHSPSADRIRRQLERRPRWGLRLWLGLAAVLLLPLVGGLVAWTSYRGAEAKAAARAAELGGRVTWSDGQPERHVIAISFADSGLDDAQLKGFKPWWWHLPALVDLDLTGTAITDEGLTHVSGAGIKNLMLGGTKITSGGLSALAVCPALGSVSLSKTLVDDAGVEYLVALPGLRTLYLDGTPITDEGLRRLEGLTSLRYLRLGGNRGVTDAGVARLEEALPEVKVTRRP